MNYWKDKNTLGVNAKIHTEEMQERYADEIKKSISNTITYLEDFKPVFPSVNKDIKITVVEMTTTEALLFYPKTDAILNFADYKEPGGRFMDGSSAQEESLCHTSFLYNVLRDGFRYYYDENKKSLNKGLYHNRALYSPNIIFEFEDGSTRECAVLTCAAPNFKVAHTFQYVSVQDNIHTLASRIKFVLDIFQEQNCKNIILGAFGCGVFGQNAKIVAGLFKQYLIRKCYSFDTVIFAVPKGINKSNYDAFYSYFNSQRK